MTSVIYELLKKQLLWKTLTKFEKMIKSRIVLKNMLSKIYGLLQGNEASSDVDRIWWQQDLKIEITDQGWSKSHGYIRVISCHVAMRKNFYKRRHRWYLTPYRLHKMFPRSDWWCWCCKQERGYLKYSGGTTKWYKFWKEVYNENIEKLKITLSFTPEACLLHLKLHKKDSLLVSYLLITAKLLIVQKWWMEKILSSHDWKFKCHFVLLIYKLTAIQQGIRQCWIFLKVWGKYINYWNEIRPQENPQQKGQILYLRELNILLPILID